MKKFFFILFLFLLAGTPLLAQDEDPGNGDGANRLQARMQEYFQRRLNMTKSESERFSPVFLRYMLELRRTHRDFQADPTMRQLKIAELRVRFRDEFRRVLDEQRANRVYEVEKEFKEIIVRELKDRRDNGPVRGGLRRNRMMAD